MKISHLPATIPSGTHSLNHDNTSTSLRELMEGEMLPGVDDGVDLAPNAVRGFVPDIKLLPHQIVGRSWIRHREDPSKDRFGGILADDMGLGKTIQMLSRIVECPSACDIEREQWGAPTLIICPLALLSQWASEILKSTDLNVLKYQGANRATVPALFEKYDVVITTYDTTASEFDVYCSKGTMTKSSLKRFTLYHVKWWRIVLDEGHIIKNPKTRKANACFELKGKYRWCMTGTPMHNTVDELFPLLKFLRVPSLSAADTFSEEIAKPLKSGKNYLPALERLQAILKEIMLRRLKDQTWKGKVLVDLPKRTVTVLSCFFEPAEREFYTLLESTFKGTVEKVLSNSDKQNRISMFLLLLRLRQACNHPILLFKDQRHSYNSDLLSMDPMEGITHLMRSTKKCSLCTTKLDAKDQGGYCLKCIPLVTKARTLIRGRRSSAKLRTIFQLIREINDRPNRDEKTIIFSQFPYMLQLIESHLADENILHVKYDGSMSAKNRELALETIRTSADTRVILISLTAGCNGLNLVSCNNIILVDPSWNPALEDQACDRVHRLGQKRDVNIYKLRVDGTVEDRILMLQEQKRTLISATLNGNSNRKQCPTLDMSSLLSLF